MEGKLIVIEGACDGIGKSTQFRLLKERLENEGYNVTTHHFPSYNTYQGLPVEKYLSGEYGDIKDLNNYFIGSLYSMDRIITWQTKLKKEYEKGNIILLDRYTTSTLIYQSALIDDIEEKNNFINFITDYEYNKVGIKRPDLVLFLNADFDLVTKLRNERKENDGIKKDIHETNLEFLRKVYNSALYTSNYLGFDEINCEENGEFRSIDSIKDDIYKLVKKKM